MDIYNSKIPLLFGKAPWAVTIWQTAYFTESPENVSAKWHEHENKHKEQWARDGIIKFLAKYIWYQIRYGYDRNPYEIEARQEQP